MVSYSPPLSVAAMGDRRGGRHPLGRARDRAAFHRPAHRGRGRQALRDVLRVLRGHREAARLGRRVARLHQWLTRYRDFREINRASATLSNLEAVLLADPAAGGGDAGALSRLEARREPGLARAHGRAIRRLPGRHVRAAGRRAGHRRHGARPRGARAGCGSARGPSSRHRPRMACAARSATSRKAPSTSSASPSPIRADRKCCATSTSPFARANSSPSSAPAARASRRCCACCWGSRSRPGNVRFDGRVLHALDLRSLRGASAPCCKAGDSGPATSSPTSWAPPASRWTMPGRRRAAQGWRPTSRRCRWACTRWSAKA